MNQLERKLIVVIESPYKARPDCIGCTKVEHKATDNAQQTLPEIIICSGCKYGLLRRNAHYLQDCLRDSLDRGEVPLASHQLYTQCLDDTIKEERELGLSCNMELIRSCASRVVLYTDLGITPGMERAEQFAHERLLHVTRRSLEEWRK